MKSIEIFNETNSNLNKAVNMAFEVTLRKIAENYVCSSDYKITAENISTIS